MTEIWMDVDSAVTVPVNILPLIAVADFKAVLASETYNEAGLELIWNFVTTAGVQTHTAITPTDTGGTYDWVNVGHGMYNIELPAAVNNTEGFGWMTGVATDALPWRGPVIGFRAAALNNALIDGGDVLDVSVTEIAGSAVSTTTAQLGVNVVQLSADATAADNAESFFDGTGYAGTNNVIPLVTTTTTATTATNVTTVNGLGAGVITSTAIATGAITNAKFAAGAIDAAAIADNAIDAGAIAADAITAAKIAAGAIDNATFAADVGSTALATNIIAKAAEKAIGVAGLSLSAIPTIAAVTTVTTTTNLTNLPAAAATAAELAKVPKSDSNVTWNATALASVNAEVDTALNTAIPGSPTANSVNERIATMDGLLLGTVAAGTHTPQTGDAYARLGAAGAGLTAVPWNAAWDAEVQSEATDALNAYDPPTNAEMEARTLVAASYATASALDAVDNFLDTEVAAILADTNELQTDWVNGGRLDLILDIIAADTTTDIPALIADVPTVAEFEARTLVAADYVVVGDTLAAVTTVTTVNGLANGAITAAAIATGAIDADALAADAGAEIADAVWDEAIAGHAGAGSTGAALAAATAPSAATVADAVWDEAIAGHAGVGSTGAALAAAGGSGDPWSTAVPGAYGAGTAGYVIGTHVPAIVADTNELQTDWVNGGRLDLILDIIAADTTTDIPALIADVPTVAEFEARTLVAADYVVVGDTLAAVTTVTTVNGLANGAITAAAIATGAIDADALAADAGAEIADAVWDEAIAGHAGAGSTGAALAAATAPSAATVADAVWDEAIAGHAGVGSTGAALAAAGGSGDPWSTALPGAYGAGTAGYIIGNQTPAAGAGAIAHTYTLTSSIGGLPIAEAQVWATTDLGGSNIVASGVTSTLGVVTFYLDAGNYYFWRSKSGWNFVNPDTEVVA